MPISSEFPYESKYLQVGDAKFHYIEEGKGDPILLIHGNPTSCYLWRNVIPHLTKYGRCIAPDLIGMGKSEKVLSHYTFLDHSHYLNEFINEMKLKNITIVGHDWGGALGSYYATQHKENIKAVVFMETLIGPMKMREFPRQVQFLFRMFRTPVIGWILISYLNRFVKDVLPRSIIRKLEKEEIQRYHEPYPTISSRLPLRVWPTQIPFDGFPQEMHALMNDVYETLKEWDVPKLILYAEPGAIMRKKKVDQIAKDLPNVKVANIGAGIHFIQEDQPDNIGNAIAKFLQEI